MVHAVLLAGRRPILTDVDECFLMSVSYGDEVAKSADLGLVLYAPYGGHAPDLEKWSLWAGRRNLPFVVDLAQTPDPSVWRRASACGATLLSSFHEGKPLGADGGGVIAGSAEIVEGAELFLNGGRDALGRKVAIGLELRLPEVASGSAVRALVEHASRVPAWRATTQRVLLEAGLGLLPGWADCEPALSRLPRLDGVGQRSHPDATFGDRPWRTAVAERLGPWCAPPLPKLEALYDRVTVTKIRPHRQQAQSRTSEEIPA